MKATAIIQARVGSTRLPGKVLMEIADKTVLEHVVERTLAATLIQEVIIATTVLNEDDAIASLAAKLGVKCFRGSSEHVLSRYYHAALHFKLNKIARITADCPLIFPDIIDEVIALHGRLNVDYASNTLERTFPRGADVEVFNFEALQKAYLEAKEPWEAEHVTPYIYRHPGSFSLANLEAAGKLRRPELRLTVDTREDLMLVKAIYYFLGGKSLKLANIIDLLQEQPWLEYINRHVKQKSLGE